MKLTARCLTAALFFATAVWGNRALADDCTAAAKRREDALRASNSMREQEDDLRAAITMCPKLAEAHFDLGLILLKQQRLDDALASFKTAADADQDPRFRLGIANVLALKGDLGGAEKEYQKALESDPRSVKALDGLSYIARSRNDYTQAEEFLRQALQLDADDASLFYNLGLVLEKQGRTEEAAVSFQTASEKRPAFVPALAKLAELRLRLGQFDAADKAIKSAILGDGTQAQFWLLAAAIAERRGSIRTAREAIDKAAALDAKNVEIAVKQAALMYSSGDRRDGLAKLSEIVEHNPENAAGHSSYAWALIQEKKLEDAQRELQKAMQLLPDDPYLQNNLGVLLELKGDTAGARKAFARAKELDPQLEHAKLGLDRTNDE